jgi:hypothetical protein
VEIAGPLAPGPYWILFAEFDPVNSRSRFSIEPGQPTELFFRSVNDRVIQRVHGDRRSARAAGT